MIKLSTLHNIHSIGSYGNFENKDEKNLIKIFSKTKSKITYVRDRAGHDFRYALNSKKIR